ncbi:hypothetical protein FH039_02355 [Thermococcus indicus]|uniref:DUF11 domain-containing protein n=1 Tax=Thermococcus indicus TaxID=2586643 RepID=A0A4Y5SKL4_9EURY|nr:DUF11 domain-containing protein [Thermococcus indicus]QDA30689.1 hypothetical protein FH039_02355 [Thermococcus indicus]
MRILFFMAAFVMGALLIIGSSGNFRTYTSDREAWVKVVSGDDSYIAYRCIENPLIIDAGSSVEFVAVTVENKMNTQISVHIAADFSNLPVGAVGNVEDTIKILNPGEIAQFRGNIESAPFASGGPYEIPVVVYAEWDGGDARIEACSINVTFSGGPTIEKELISGDTEVPAHTYQEWTFRIRVTNPGIARNLTIKDAVKGEFEIDSITPSTGSYTVTQTGAAHHIVWNIELNAGETAYMDVTIHTKLNPAGKQEFTSCGDYILNDGAEIVGYNVTSNGIVVRATCEGNDCLLDVMNTKVSGPGRLTANTPADYHTRISVENTGGEKTVVIKQYIGRYFTLTGYSPSRGNVTIEPAFTGGTIVTWTFHLSPGDAEFLDLYEHTSGIPVCGHPRPVLVTSKVYVAGCGCTADPIHVMVTKGCGCHSGISDGETEGSILNNTESCDAQTEGTCPGMDGG